MLTADRVTAAAIMAFSIYFMWHATVLPVGWNGETGGPGGGAFPFWLAAVMLGCGAGVLVRSLRGKTDYSGAFFDPDTIRSVISVAISVVVTIGLIPWVGAYVALPLFLVWYLRLFGGHGWTLTAILAIATPVALFFFFEVTLKILLPKGLTEPFFLPLYARFF